MSSLVLMLAALVAVGAGAWGLMKARRTHSQALAVLAVGIVGSAFVVLGALGIDALTSGKGTPAETAPWLAVVAAVAASGYLRYAGRRRPEAVASRTQTAVRPSSEPASAPPPAASSPSPPAKSSPPLPALSTPEPGPVARQSPSAPMLFLSYRRSDSADVTGRIYDRLAGHFGKHNVFKDVDSIALGLDFRRQIADAVGQCEVVLAIVGRQWHGGPTPEGSDRLHDPRDFVRIEIESAIERHIPVIPVLVQGASVPAPEALPPSLRDLGYRHAIQVRTDPDFHNDIDRLVKGIEGHLGTR